MVSRLSRLLFWGMVWLSGCGSADENASDALASAGSSALPEAGSGGSRIPPSTSAAGNRAASATVAGSSARAGASGTPSTGVRPPEAGRSSSTGGAGSAAAVGGSSGNPGEAGKAAAGSGAVPTEKFSFFVTSLEAMRRLSKSENGFGGDLRYGEANGLAGADKICSEIAESSMPGAAGKGWHAFLSAKTGGPSGGAVHAKDRIGKGPWYDRTGRMVAMDLASLLQTRPGGADPAIGDNLPNEKGEPNRANEDVDNHDTITGSSETGEYSAGATCEDWTTSVTPPAAGSSGGGMRGNSRGPMCGHSWPAQSGQSWIQAHNAPGCAPSVSLVQMGGGSGDGIGNSGGYGGIYCFALSP